VLNRAACRGIAEDSTAQALDNLRAAGVHIVADTGEMETGG
jgi:hypothetical protein